MIHHCDYGRGLLTALQGSVMKAGSPLYQRGALDGFHAKKTDRFTKHFCRCVGCEKRSSSCDVLYQPESELNLSEYNGIEGKFIGSLLGTAIGDALGFPFETIKNEDLRAQRVYINGLIGTLFHPRGIYSDDTELTLLLANMLKESKEFSSDAFRQEIMKWASTNSRTPGSGMIKYVQSLQSGISFDTSQNIGNGICSRISPIALRYYNDEQSLIQTIDCYARLTHNNSTAVAAALIVSQCISWSVTRTPETFDRDALCEHMLSLSKNLDDSVYKKLDCIIHSLQKPVRQVIETIGTRPVVTESVIISIYSFLREYDDARRALLLAVNTEGDRDTVGAITGSMIGALHGVKGIPSMWIKKIENPSGIIQAGKELFQSYYADSTRI
ncbi:ADP-ribosylglycohydrolase family protein [Candidatus Woesearchaeota archaeon]|nr:ADP-ribosylglycohydrolase family protein [Candidatus Woesearchaeota archaeon]